MSRSEVPARCKLAVIFVYWGWRGVTTSDGWLHSLWRYCRACSTANSRIDVTAWHVIYSCNDELSSFVMCSQWTQKLMPLTYIQHFNDHFPGEPGLISQPTDFLSQWFLCIQIISEKVKIFHILPTSTHPVFLGCPPSSSTYLLSSYNASGNQHRCFTCSHKLKHHMQNNCKALGSTVINTNHSRSKTYDISILLDVRIKEEKDKPEICEHYLLQ